LKNQNDDAVLEMESLINQSKGIFVVYKAGHNVAHPLEVLMVNLNAQYQRYLETK
jgi:hypothetical protein